MNEALSFRLKRFLNAFRQAREGEGQRAKVDAVAWAHRLPTFLEAFCAIRPVAPSQVARRASATPERLAELFRRLAPPLAHARETGVLINPWVMAGLRRNEVRNAAVLAQFLSPRTCGKLALDFLDAFLAPMRPRPGIPAREELQAGYHVRTEHCVAASLRDRVDLTIEGRTFVLGIEVKIDAREGELQLDRYVETIGRWGERQGKTAAVIFLAPFPSGRSDVVDANWASIAAASRKATSRQALNRTESRRLLQQFAAHAAGF